MNKCSGCTFLKKRKLPAREAVTSFAKTSLLNEIQISFRCNCMATWRMENKENSTKAKIVATPQIPATFIQAEKRKTNVSDTIITYSMVSIKCSCLYFHPKNFFESLSTYKSKSSWTNDLCLSQVSNSKSRKTNWSIGNF